LARFVTVTAMAEGAKPTATMAAAIKLLSGI
jgi:hypothetical protein